MAGLLFRADFFRDVLREVPRCLRGTVRNKAWGMVRDADSGVLR